MKIAFLHDLLVKLGGAEKVLEKLMNMYPQADIFTLIYDEEKVGKVFPKTKIKYVPKMTQTVYQITKNQRYCLPFMSKGVESFDLSEYDVVIASHSAFVHGALTKPETKFIVYYHTPARYMWDRTNEYKKEIGWNSGIKLFLLNSQLKKLRMWDYEASQRHDITVANSNNVVNRIKKYYKLNAQTIYPNVNTKQFQKNIPSLFPLPTKKYYLITSALTEFKKIDIAIQAFLNMPEKKLLIIGTGNYRENLEKMSKQNEKGNISFLGPKYGDELVYMLQNAQGLIFPGEEDFGIVPIESFASGTPVFAYRGGGLEETMVEGVTGEFFDEKDGSDFIEKFKIFENNIISQKYEKELIQKVAEKYSEETFEAKIRAIVE